MKIKNWPKFQHFKDRRPPWIKLYRDLLDDDEWFSLPPISAKALVTLWLLASEDETKQGVLPPFKKIAFRLRMSEKSLQSIVSDLSHWLIQDDINAISSCHQLGPSETEAYKAETYTTETETAVAPPLRATAIVNEEWLTALKTNPAYLHINWTIEWGKMDAWFGKPGNRHRKRTQSFILNWINKVEAPIDTIKQPRKVVL